MDSSDTHSTSQSARRGLQAVALESTLDGITAPDSGIAIHDRDLRCIAWSNLCEQLSELPKSQALHSHRSFDTPLLQALGGKRALQSALFGGTITVPDVLIGPAGQAPRWIACTHTPLYGPANEIIGVISQLCDVSPQKSALNQIQGMLSEVRDLYQDGPAGHHSVDANGVFTQMNNTELAWLGYTREEVIGHMRLSDIVTAESAERIKQNFYKLREVGRVDEVEYDFLRKDGTSFPGLLSGKASYNMDGTFAGGRATVIDITEHRKMGNALRLAQESVAKRERLFASLVENSYDGVALFNPDGRVSYISPAVTRILGFTPAEFIGARIFKYIHADDRSRVKEWTIELLQHPDSQHTTEIRFRTKAGSWLWLELTNSNQLQNGAVAAVVSNFRDISERKEREAELLATNNRLLELSRHLRTSIEMERTRIARELHDELGSMLTAVKMYLGKPDQTGTASGIQGHGRAIELVDSANESIARIVTNLRPSLLDHRGLMPAIRWLAKEFEEQNGIACEFSTRTEVTEDDLADNDKTAIFRIIQEALHNASQHAKASIISITIQQDAAGLLVEIRDDGVGFECNKAALRPSWGVIGMRERAAELGGDCAIQTAPGHGTIVTVRLPAHRFASISATETKSTVSGK